jgi:hypothetical protein
VTLTVFLAVLFAALLHAGWNAVVKLGLDRFSSVLLLALVPFVANRGAAPRSGETFTREWAVDLLNSVEPYGILITGGDDDTFPLWYAQEVEGVRRDVTVAVTSLMGLDWYGRQLIRRPIYDYDAARGPAIYRSVRPGMAGKPFRCLKFRTMRDKADQAQDDLEPLNEKSGAMFKIRHDPRLTPVDHHRPVPAAAVRDRQARARPRAGRLPGRPP